MSTQKADYHLQTVKYDILWDNEFTAIKHFLTEFARLAQTAIEKVAQWFVWICKQVGDESEDLKTVMVGYQDKKAHHQI